MANLITLNENSLKDIDKETHLFIEVIEDEALKQFKDCLSSPYVVKGSLMPDAHTGYTAPIGSVFASDGHIFPSFVGIDQGCGMAAVKTEFKREEVFNKRDIIYQRVLSKLPVGRGKNNRKNLKHFEHNHDISDYANEIFMKKGPEQLGTLGGGK